MQSFDEYPPGRPLKFQSVEELEAKIDAYFANCDPHVEFVTEWVQARDTKGALKKDENGNNYLVEISHNIKTEQIPYTVTGLALALDTNRQTLINYESGEYHTKEIDKETRQGFIDAIKRAKVKIENYNEVMLYTPSPTGTIFNLKNNFGWKDKTEQDITSGGDKLSPFANLSEDELRKLAAS